jgi:hypothetical protein
MNINTNFKTILLNENILHVGKPWMENTFETLVDLVESTAAK